MQGNKRTVTVTALIFLQKNSYAVKEFYQDEIATVLLEFLDNNKNTDRKIWLIISQSEPIPLTNSKLLNPAQNPVYPREKMKADILFLCPNRAQIFKIAFLKMG
jgi:hypothetical protein